MMDFATNMSTRQDKEIIKLKSEIKLLKKIMRVMQEGWTEEREEEFANDLRERYLLAFLGDHIREIT